MNSFVVFIYLCAASTAPADCDRRTAIDVVLGPQATNELTCGLGAQEIMAKTAIRPEDGEYFKIACVRHKVVAAD
jgi:hypothetical protein